MVKIITQISLWLLIIGGLNWGLVGFFNLDIVTFLLGAMVARIIFAVVGLAAIWVLVDMFSNHRLNEIER